MPKDNMARYIILGLLSQGPKSGYAIKKWVELSISYFWDISYGQIYPTLRHLEQEGLATMKMETADKGPSSKVYNITDDGREELRKWLRRSEEKQYEILLKIFFGSEISKEELIKKLEGFISKRKIDIDVLEKAEKELRGTPKKDPNEINMLLITTLGVMSYRTEIEWSMRSIEMLKDGKKQKNKK
ncbi:PadR family transcriptional regulator [Methanocella sp. CWC-04]|uniref:PadR family transcriptional regulator n=1 Tax=Methanooceanicella nereidis TaxID=2052831 RepID=A0AAP2W669_9EURY|nr:PadR family transcriptional regulator [Methanocella sp. CWC-04]MCD1295048.1 PadR family transcriptional regulator [Methanocella sp. CWC-04]